MMVVNSNIVGIISFQGDDDDSRLTILDNITTTIITLLQLQLPLILILILLILILLILILNLNTIY